MKILLLSAYDAASHQRWREGLVNYFLEYEWTVLTLPPRHFSWRMRGNSLTWAFNERETLDKKYDLVIATSMTDLSALRGMVPNLAVIPTIVYFHENQFAYPLSENTEKGASHSLRQMQVTGMYTALCADRIVFNSEYNRTTFLRGIGTFLKQMPDHVPTGLVQLLREKSCVLPVPLEEEYFQKFLAKKSIDRFYIVWNHRWEYDKGPERLLACINELTEDLPLTFHIVGQRFRSIPESFVQIKEILESRGWVGMWGFIEDRTQYLDLLSSCHAVLSTALHDFQGLAVLEAVATGCVPIVPNRLAYPQLFAPEFLYQNDEKILLREAASSAAMIEFRIRQFLVKEGIKTPDISSLNWTTLGPIYRELLKTFVLDSC